MTPQPSARAPNAMGVAKVTALVLVTLGLGVACKKEIDPNAFDAGAPSQSATTASGATTPSEPSAPDPAAAGTDVAPLAPLNSAAPPKPAAAATNLAAKPATAGTSTAGAAKPAAAAIPECDKAKQFCGHPALKTDAAIQALCTKYKDECTKKGGHP